MVTFNASNNKLLAAILLLCATLWGGAIHAATLTASIDRSTVSIDETLTLTLQIDSRSVTGQPDLTPLTDKFQILNRSKSTQIRAINGRSEASTRWELQLAPLVAGDVVIPPFNLNGAYSQPLQLTVTAAQPSSRKPVVANDEVTLQLSVNNKDVYVGQQVLASLQLQTSIGLTSLELEQLSLDNAEVIPLGEQQFQKTQNGRRYQIYQLNYAIIPRQVGALNLPSLRMVALKQQPRTQYGSRRGQSLQLKTQSQAINVKPQPPGYTSGYNNSWLPASQLSLKQTLSRPTDGYRVGTPISRQLQINAQGLQANRLPELIFSPQAGVKHYPEPAKLDQKKSAAGLDASQVESYVLVPTRAGTITLPAIEIRWWDTLNDRPQVARIDEQTLEVLAADNVIEPNRNVQVPIAATQPAPTTPNTSGNSGGVATNFQHSNTSTKERLITNIAWALLCALLATLWLRARARSPSQTAKSQVTSEVGQTPTNDEELAYQQLQAACRQGDWQSIRNALADWRQLAEPPALENEALTKQIKRLDQALYGDRKNLEFDCEQLLQAVRECRQKQTRSSAEKTVLPALYR